MAPTAAGRTNTPSISASPPSNSPQMLSWSTSHNSPVCPPSHWKNAAKGPVLDFK